MLSPSANCMTLGQIRIGSPERRPVSAELKGRAHGGRCGVRIRGPSTPHYPYGADECADNDEHCEARRSPRRRRGAERFYSHGVCERLGWIAHAEHAAHESGLYGTIAFRTMPIRHARRRAGRVICCAGRQGLRRSRRRGSSRKFDREDAPFARQVACGDGAAQRFGGAGDYG